jgi:hypothetical protein
VKSTGGREYEYIVYSHAVYMRRLRLAENEPDKFNMCIIAENESQKKIYDVMTDNAHKLCMGEMKDMRVLSFTRRYDAPQNRTG